jgi:2-oxoglutarate dehydrogenase E1 component
VRIAQLYPFPHEHFKAMVDKYANATEVVWCQEEPRNQGAWRWVQHYVLRHMRSGQKLGYAGRPSSASPAVGYKSLHEKQLKEFINNALAEDVLADVVD